MNFTTEPVTILTFEIPATPVDYTSDGIWSLTNNDNVLLTTDANTNIDSSYEIISLTDETVIITGIIPFSQNIAGMDINLDIDVEMILHKQ